MTDNKYANQSIKCSVTSCKYHNKDRDYCSLEEIKVDSDEVHPTDSQCTCCDSFAPEA